MPARASTAAPRITWRGCASRRPPGSTPSAASALDGEDILNRRLIDTVANLSLGKVTLSAGYLYSPPLPYLNPSRSREEVGAGVTARIGDYWRVSVGGKYDLGLGRPVLVQGSAGYEDECFILESRFIKRFAEDPTTANLYPADTVVLFRLGLQRWANIVPGDLIPTIR